MRLKRSFYLLFALLLTFSSFSSIAVPKSHAAPLENGVTVKVIDKSGEEIIPLSALSFDKGDTAIDVLEAVADKEDIQLDLEEHPDFGTMILGIGEVTEEIDSYWSFIVNGIAAEVGASTYEVTNGDHILFSLTDQFEPSVKVLVSAINGEEDIFKDSEVMLMEHASGYDALIQATATNDVTLKATVDDEYFTFIENIDDTELDETEFWSISVNDEDLMTGILEYEAKSGDHIKLEVKSFDLPDDTENQDSPNNNEDIDKDSIHIISEDSIKEHIKEITDYFKTKDIDLTYGTEWWIWGLANTNMEIPKDYIESVKEEVIKVDGKFKNVTDLERIVIALSLLGKDASNVEDYDLIDLLVNHSQLDKPLINASVYALLAFNSDNYNVEEDIQEKLVQHILDQELEHGGWSFTNDEASADITGMVLAALAPYHDEEAVQEAINRAIDFLSINQSENGGYDDALNGGYTSESVAQVIIGLTAVGVNPTNNEFTKNDINLLQHLLLFKQDDSGYGHSLEDNESSNMSTSQVLLAFTAYDNYLNELGSVYQYSEQDKPVEKVEDEIDSSSSEKPINYLLVFAGIIVMGGVLIVILLKRNKKNK